MTKGKGMTINGNGNSHRIGSLGIRPSLVLFGVFSCFTVWAIHVLSAATWLDASGNRYYVLFDDAMISMRYAFNLAHGHGLVWNVGERVEGYTNPLWTIIMAALQWISNPYVAPLLVQLAGLVLLLGAAGFAFLAGKELAGETTAWRHLAGILSATGVLGYYPLAFWSLAGMEVSLLGCALSAGVLATIRFHNGNEIRHLNALLLCIIVAYFTRPDGWLPFIPMALFCVRRSLQVDTFAHLVKKTLAVVLTGGGLIAAHLVWRFLYYGSFVPNTYVLKMQGRPLDLRLTNGLSFISPYLLSISIALALAIFAALIAERNKRSLYLSLVSVPLVAVAYQIFVGGDPWPYWRQMAPSFFLLPLASSCGLLALKRIPRANTLLLTVIFFCIFVFGVFVLPNKDFRREALLQIPPFSFPHNVFHGRTGLALHEVLTPRASVMAFWAGAIPYFASCYGVDPLGKMDPYVARLPLDTGVAWAGMRGVPGHDKYDLRHSLVERSPDYIQGWKWFNQDESAYVRTNYVLAVHQGLGLCLKRDSKHVHWDRVKIVGECK